MTRYYFDTYDGSTWCTDDEGQKHPTEQQALKLAYEALTLEDKIGTMLPCNVIVQQHDGGIVEISAVDPVASMSAIENPKLGKVAGQVRELLKQVVSDIVE